jgi:hypothetical protein
MNSDNHALGTRGIKVVWRLSTGSALKLSPHKLAIDIIFQGGISPDFNIPGDIAGIDNAESDGRV